MMDTPLPEFTSPPVSEVTLGVQFSTLPNWHIPHFGVYWQEIRADYPSFEVQPPIQSVIETFEQTFGGSAVETIIDAEQVRCWFLSADGTKLVQVQRDRFHVNWKKVTGNEHYPRYEQAVRPAFDREWARFCAFLRTHDIGEPNVVQAEVTYVNDIARGEGWDTFGDLSQVLAPYAPGGQRFLPAPETVRLHSAYRMPEQKGRLHLSVRHARRTRDEKEILQMGLTARGRPTSSKTDDVLAWMDLAREWIVRGFTDITTSQMHARWGRVR